MSGSSSSVFICVATVWCAFAIDSTSNRITSSDDLREPNSTEPSGFLERAKSLRENSSSRAARAVVRVSDHDIAMRILRKGMVCTRVEGFKFFARRFCIVHAREQGINAGIVFTPEIVGNYRIPGISDWTITIAPAP
jgi:hypothetical protein